MNELLTLNVNGKTEKKNGLTYLSWAWAWAEVLKLDPEATWEPIEYPQSDGTLAPCMYLGNGSAMVKVRVTIKGRARTCVLPVMDHKNKAISQPDAFAVNTAIMRCMTKAVSMHGLGLYIYAGEDLPEVDPEAAAKQAAQMRAAWLEEQATKLQDCKTAEDLQSVWKAAFRVMKQENDDDAIATLTPIKDRAKAALEAA